jgi:starch phosphorylase
MTQPGTRFTLEVNPQLPARLARLQDLANDLWYGWDRQARSLFARLSPSLWEASGHSPKAFLKRVDEWRLAQAAEDNVFISTYNRVLSEYDSYLQQPLRRENGDWLGADDLVAYFCAEFGFHESLPIYSGGLGILAGDHCKAASDTRLPFVAVGLLYRQGYFTQTIDGEGNQRAVYTDSDFEDLPIAPASGADGRELHVPVELAGRTIQVKVWIARVGHVRLYLLDTDLDDNSEHDRFITHRLYGGDRVTRIEQEIVLGVGGARALLALGIKPTVWHINEGHAAFLVLERARLLAQGGVPFQAAIEAVATSTVFTTHTAVPAGHDHFAEDMMGRYFEGYCRDVGIEIGELLALGRTPQSGDFNMTALAIRGSRHHNGVSRIHGGVSAQMLKDLWPQVPPEENPIDYVTNGVHVPTFLAPEWTDIFERFVGSDWTQRLTDREYWQRVHDVPDHIFWSARQYLKAQMLHLVRHRIRAQHARNGGSESHLDRLFKYCDPANPNVLTIGFGRRFATYKRAALLFNDLDLLRTIVGDPDRPVVFLFAGKAHPADGPGQDLIRQITEVSRRPEFEGRLLLVEGYDLRLARRLVSGVDVWLNNPIYPLEASGTSGMKAAMNGVLNLSVLDGWWGEGHDGSNGWAIKPAAETLEPHRRDHEEARTLYELLQDQVAPLYYDDRGAAGFSHNWVRMAKQAIATLLPRFSATRMVGQYVTKFYMPAARAGRRHEADGCAVAREVSAWKARVRAAWPKVGLRRIDEPTRRITFGQSMRIDVAVNLDGLSADDVTVELLLDPNACEPQEPGVSALFLTPTGDRTSQGERVFTLDLRPEFCGKLDYRIRTYPSHRMLTHPFEMGLMTWL